MLFRLKIVPSLREMVLFYTNFNYKFSYLWSRVEGHKTTQYACNINDINWLSLMLCSFGRPGMRFWRICCLHTRSNLEISTCTFNSHPMIHDFSRTLPQRWSSIEWKQYLAVERTVFNIPDSSNCKSVEQVQCIDPSAFFQYIHNRPICWVPCLKLDIFEKNHKLKKRQNSRRNSNWSKYVTF